MVWGRNHNLRLSQYVRLHQRRRRRQLLLLGQILSLLLLLRAARSRSVAETTALIETKSVECRIASTVATTGVVKITADATTATTT
jgi:hypothetical protein